MDKVQSLGHSSISVPALGTGTLNFTEELVAKLLLNEALEFSLKHKSKLKIKNFNIVVYSGNTKAVQVFSKQFREFSIIKVKENRDMVKWTTRQCNYNNEVVNRRKVKVEIVQRNIVHESTEAIGFTVSESVYQGRITKSIRCCRIKYHKLNISITAPLTESFNTAGIFFKEKMEKEISQCESI